MLQIWLHNDYSLTYNTDCSNKVLIHSGSAQDLMQIHDDIMCNGNKECRLGSVQHCVTMKPTSCPQ